MSIGFFCASLSPWVIRHSSGLNRLTTNACPDNPTNKKPAFPAGQILSAGNCLPSPERPVIFAFPVRQFRGNGDVRFNVKAEKCPVLEHDTDGISVFSGHDFHAFNDLAFNFRECVSFTFTAGVCNLRDSHGSPFFGR